MSKYNAKALIQGFGLEENDLNININAEHEGDKGEGDATDFGVGAGETPVAEVPAVETETVEAAVEEPAAVVEEDTSGTPEAAELDVADAGGGVAETNELIEDVSEAAEGLEGIALTLAQISVEGLEVNAAAHAILLDQYKFVTRKFPALQTEKKGIPSFEAFTVSEEGVTVSLEKVVDNLKSAGKALLQYLKDMWVKFLALLNNVNAAIQVMKKKATELSTAKVGTAPESVNIPGFISKIASGTAVQDITLLTEVIKNMTTARYESIIAAVTSGKDVSEAMKTINQTLINKQGSGGQMLGGFKIEANEDGTVKATSTESGESKSSKPFDQAKVNATAKAVVDLASALEDYNRGESNRKKVNDFIISELAKGDVGSDDAGKIAKWKAARKAGTAWSKQIGFEQVVVRKAISVGNAVNNVLAASLGKAVKAAEGKTGGAPQIGEQTSRKGSW
jgi:hypothetical protein